MTASDSQLSALSSRLGLPFFRTDARVAALRAAADRWAGTYSGRPTPFAPAGAVWGPRGGVCCHRGVVAVASESGLPWRQEEVPDAPLNRGAHHHGSLMAEWLRTHRERFAEISPGGGRELADLVQPGDVLLIRNGVGTHHSAIALDRGEIFQVLQDIGAHIVRPVERRHRQRLWAVFRPLDTALSSQPSALS